jgi:AraC-like DNA-binding protein
MLYLDPAVVARAAGQLADREGVAVPFFPDPVIAERDVAADFLRLHHALDGGGTRLEQDSRLLHVLARLIREHSGAGRDPRRTRPERAGVAAARRRLHEGLADDVRLAELAELARLSPFHLARVFRAEVGLPPHAYQTGLRVERARVLLARGRTVSDTAQEVGFYDASHLSRHFVRVVGVPPGRYRAAARGDAPHRARTSTTRHPGSA